MTAFEFYGRPYRVDESPSLELLNSTGHVGHDLMQQPLPCRARAQRKKPTSKVGKTASETARSYNAALHRRERLTHRFLAHGLHTWPLRKPWISRSDWNNHPVCLVATNHARSRISPQMLAAVFPRISLVIGIFLPSFIIA